MMRWVSAYVLVLPGCAPLPPQPPVFRAQNLHAQPSEVRVVNEDGAARIEVISEGGIGRASVELVSGEWPATTVVRLHLKGLEGFTASSGAARLEKEDLTIEHHRQGAAPYFDVRLPQSLLKGESRIELQWVDFYR